MNKSLSVVPWWSPKFCRVKGQQRRRRVISNMSQFSENLGEYFIKNPILKSNPILLVKKPYNNSSRWNINLGKMHKWWKMNETSITIQFAIVHPAINHKLPYITAEQFLLQNTKIGPRFFFFQTFWCIYKNFLSLMLCLDITWNEKRNSQHTSKLQK